MPDAHPSAERARVAMMRGRHAEAAELFLEALPHEPRLSTLDETQRHYALLVAMCLRSAGEVERAAAFVDRLEGSTSQVTPSIAGFEPLVDEALARERSGAFTQAAERYERAGRFIDAARCHAAVNDDIEQLRALARVRADHPRYLEAVKTALPVATRVPTLDFRFEQFVSTILEDPAHALHSAVLDVFDKQGIAVMTGQSSSVDSPPPLPDLPPLRSAAAKTPTAAPSIQMPLGAPAIGARLADRYRLDGVVGLGGTCVVYRAFDEVKRKPIALKLFHPPEHNMPADSLDRFKREVGFTENVRHPNVLELFEVGEGDGRWFISMELLEGQTLRQVLAKRQQLQIPLTLDYLRQAASGLAAAHDVGVVHRDVKPANLFVTREGLLKVMDFGIARSLRDTGHTQAGMMLGTPKYMAPEQISGFAPVTNATDIYALGVLAYGMTTGRLPFRHAESLPILMMHLTRAPRPLRELVRDLPAALESLILRMLLKNPSDRPQSMREVCALLDEFS